MCMLRGANSIWTVRFNGDSQLNFARVPKRMQQLLRFDSIRLFQFCCVERSPPLPRVRQSSAVAEFACLPYLIDRPLLLCSLSSRNPGQDFRERGQVQRSVEVIGDQLSHCDALRGYELPETPGRHQRGR